MTSCFALRRVSEGEIGQWNAYNTSLDRQQTFLSRFAPHDYQVKTLEFVSIARDGTGVISALQEMQDCLVIVTSIDRLARNPQAILQIRDIAPARNLHVLAFLFPPTTILEPSRIPNPIASHVQAKLSPLSPISCQSKSWPGCWPTFIAGPTVDPEVIPLVERRIHSAQDFISGFRISGYRGDPAITIPVAFKSGNGQRGMSAPVRAALRGEVFTRCGNNRNADTVKVVLFEGDNASHCRCLLTQCDASCRCTCQAKCATNYKRVCSTGGGGCGELCPCTDHNVHR